MGWFERQARGRDVREVEREHARYVRASGLDRALEGLAGPFGLRRFVLFFERRGGSVVVTDLDAQALQWGGGPPPIDATGTRLKGVERALTQLYRNMAGGPAWSQGAVGFVRNAEGQSRLFTWFDDDCAGANLERLPIPGPPGHPLESNDYRRMLAQWDAAMAVVHKATQARSHDWNLWTIRAGSELELQIGELGQPGFHVQRHHCVALGTWISQLNRFEWLVSEPLFPDEAFRHAQISCDIGNAMELALLAAARLGAGWLFSGSIADPAGTLFAAVRG